MAEYSRFFGGEEGSEPEYNQTQFAEVLSKIFTDGVFTDIEDELAVVENDPVSMSVVVGLGEAWIQGFWYQNTADLTKSLAEADPDDDRIDRIVLRLDTVTNFKISIEVLTGTPAGSPSAPALTQTASTYEISLAQVLVEATVTSIADAKITDERTYAAVTGLATSGIVVNTTGINNNLLLNPEFQDSNNDGLPDYWALMGGPPTLAIAADTLFPALKGNQVTVTATGGTEGIRIVGGTANWLLVKPSTTYTFSMDYKVVTDRGALRIYSYNGATIGTAHVLEAIWETSPTRITKTFTTDADATNLAIWIYMGDGTSCIYSHPKLEEGSVATPYLPPSRERKYVSAITSSATPTPIIQARNNMFIITALAAAAEFAAPTYAGYPAPIDGDSLLIRVKDNGTGRALTYNAIFTETYSSALPASTTISKTLILFFIYNSVAEKWQLLFTDEEA
jgi:hypothetical protein